MSLIRRFLGAFVWNHLNKITGYFLDFCLSVVLARGLGAYAYGVYSELLNIVFFFSLICSLGVDTGVNAYIPKYADNAGQISTLLRKTSLLIGASSVVVFLLVILFKAEITEVLISHELASYLVVGAIYSTIYNFQIVVQSVLTSFYKTRFLFFANTSLKLMFIISSFILIRNDMGIQEIMIAFTISSTFVGLGYAIRLMPYMRVTPKPLRLNSYLRFSLTTWLTKFLNYFLGRYFDIFLLGYFGTQKQQIGYYALAFSWTIALSYVITSGFAGVIITGFSEMAQRGDQKGVAEGWLAVCKMSVFFCVPLFAFVIVHANAIVGFVYSDAYLGAVVLFQVFACFFLTSLLVGGGTNTAALYSLNKEKAVLWLRALFGLLNVILDVLLIPRFQALGAIVATGFSTVAIICAEYLLVRRHLDINYPVMFVGKVLVASTVPLLLTTIIRGDQVWNLILNGLLYFVGFLALTIFLKPLTNEDKSRIRNINRRIGLVFDYF